MFFGGKLLRPASLSKFSAFPNFRVFRSAPAVLPHPRHARAYEIEVIRAFVAAQRVA